MVYFPRPIGSRSSPPAGLVQSAVLARQHAPGSALLGGDGQAHLRVTVTVRVRVRVRVRV